MSGWTGKVATFLRDFSSLLDALGAFSFNLFVFFCLNYTPKTNKNFLEIFYLISFI